MLVSVEPGAALRSGYVLRALLPTAVAAGAVNTVTGATRFSSNPSSPASARVGESFAMVFAVTGTPSTPKSYAIDGPLPAGLSVPGATVNGTQRTLNASSGQISGTPTESGTFTVEIRAYEGSNRTKKSTNIYSYTIEVSGGVANTAPSFTSQPVSQTVDEGTSVTFTVEVAGTPAPTLQWRKDGVDLPGQTSTTLSLSSVTTADAGNYSCVATNAAGTATSATATLTVNVPPPPPPADVAPSFTTHPTSQTVTEGANVTFTVEATGTPAPSYQWRHDGIDLPGQTGNTLTLTNVTTADAGSYSCVASNSAGSTTSNTATLTVNATTPTPPPPTTSAPSFSTQPTSLTVDEGSTATFSVAVAGTPSPSLQWQKDGVDLPGETGTTLTLTNVTSADAGAYGCVATNTAGSATSHLAILTVNVPTPTPPPASATFSIIGQPLSLSVLNGNDAIFTVRATGTNLTYQWLKDGQPIAGATSEILHIANVQSADAGSYSVQVSDHSGATLTSDPATLAVVSSGFSRIVNVSTRAGIRKSTDAVIPGFVIEGDIALTVLIRAVGPGLAEFGVTDVIEDPVLTLNRGPTAIAANDNWSDFPDQDAMQAATESAGAFQLALGSQDAALLVTLAPGAYTVHVADKDGGSGEALVELNTIGSSGIPQARPAAPGNNTDDEHEDEDDDEDDD